MAVAEVVRLRIGVPRGKVAALVAAVSKDLLESPMVSLTRIIAILFAGLVGPITSASEPQLVAVHKHEAWVGAVAFSPDSRLLATGSAEKIATVREVAT